MSVTLSEVRRAARAHRAPLAGESAGYLVLALADQVLRAPRLIEAEDVELTDDGGLRVLGGQASSETEAELSLRRALDGLLLVASSGSAALMRASRRVSPVGLPALVRELEAALIPVNRSAARRALARLQRETARALASGSLAEEEPELRAPTPPPELDEAETRAIPLVAAAHGPEPVPVEPGLSRLDAVPSAPCQEPEVTLEASPLSDALTVALDVRPVDGTGVAETVLIEEDVEFIDEEPSDALTVVCNVGVAPRAAAAEPAPGAVELPEEACTRPEPIVLRRALGSLAQPEVVPAVGEALPRTPTLGSLAAELPVLAPELIAEMTRREIAAESLAQALLSVEPEPSAPAAVAEVEVEVWVVSSAPNEDCTEPMPEVAQLSPAEAIVVSRKSDVSELLADFQVDPDDAHQGLRRAIKELAELELTPAPFAALIR